MFLKNWYKRDPDTCQQLVWGDTNVLFLAKKVKSTLKSFFLLPPVACRLWLVFYPESFCLQKFLAPFSHECFYQWVKQWTILHYPCCRQVVATQRSCPSPILPLAVCAGTHSSGTLMWHFEITSGTATIATTLFATCNCARPPQRFLDELSV